MFINEALDVRDFQFAELNDLVDVRLFKPNIRILFVVDGSVGVGLGDGAFAVGKVAELLRGTTVGCTSMSVDVARRASFNGQAFTDNPAATGCWRESRDRWLPRDLYLRLCSRKLG